MDGPVSGIQGDSAVPADVQFLQWDPQASAVCFYDTFFCRPELVECADGCWRMANGDPLFRGELVLEIVEGNVGDGFNIDTYAAPGTDNAYYPVAGMRDTEIW